MGQYEYKVLPTPRRAKRAKGVKGEPARFAHVLTEAINAEAKDGWEYYKSETLPMEMRPGFLKSRVETFQSLLIFRRLIEVKTEEEDVSTTSIAAALPAVAIADQVIETPEKIEPTIDAPTMVEASDLDDTDAVEQVKEAVDTVAFDEDDIDPLKNMVESHRSQKVSE